MKIKIIKTCHDCEYCHHTGSYGSQPKYVCHNSEVLKNKHEVNSKYWYEFPVLDRVSLKAKLEIPNWCPLEDYRK